MYARSHIYLTEKITKSKNILLLFGSIFPDFHQTSALPKGFDQQVLSLLKFVKQNHPNFLPLTLGMTLHEFPIGVDRFVHQSYQGKEGYAFQFVEDLFSETKETLGFDESTTKLMIHFLVENAIEHKIIQEHPEVDQQLRDILKTIDQKKIINLLSNFYQVTEKDLEKEFKVFYHKNLDYDPTTYLGLAEVWVEDMQRFFNKEIKPEDVIKLIKKTEQVIAPTVDQFLQDCIAQCKEEFEFNFGKLRKKIK